MSFTHLDNVLMENHHNLPKKLKEKRMEIHAKIDDPKGIFSKEEVMLILDWLLDNPVKDSKALAKFVIDACVEGLD